MMLGIRFFTSGKDGGTLRIDLDKVIPASTHDLKIITSTCEASTDCSANIDAIHDHIALKVHDLQNEREALDPERNKAEISKINALIKRYINNNDQLVKGYGVEAITDEGATIKLTAAKVIHLLRTAPATKLKSATAGHSQKTASPSKLTKITNSKHTLLCYPVPAYS